MPIEITIINSPSNANVAQTSHTFPDAGGTLGRGSDNLWILDDPNKYMSSVHAKIACLAEQYFLTDLSTNGTFVNGQTIKKHFLQSGEVITLGKYSLKYINDVVPSTKNDDFERTMIFRPGTAAIASMAAMSTPTSMQSQVGFTDADARFDGYPGNERLAGSAAAVTVESIPASASIRPLGFSDQKMPSLPLGAIQILSGNNAGKELELTKGLTTLGKPKIQVAVIARRPQGYFITHVEGETFPVINGISVGAQAQALKDYDVIELAGIKMTFFLKH